ncbi:HDOD domain-containing protein [Colwelliaceae bacterium 6471]
MSAENALYSILADKIEQNTLVLPLLPEIALKVRQKASDPKVSLHDLGRLISHDATLSLDIIRVANSAALGGIKKVESVQQAVSRIGLDNIKTIVTAMAIKQVFTSDNANISMHINSLWTKTVDVASVAISLFSFYRQNHRFTPLNSDLLTLVSLVHNIGVLPILTEAALHEKLFAAPKFLKHAVINLSNDIGMKITQAWGLPDEVTMVVGSWQDLMFHTTDAQYIDFLRAGALHCGIFTNEVTHKNLTADYLDKNILPHKHFMQSEEFTEMLTKTKSTFT